MIRILLLDDIIAILEIGHRNAAPPRLIKILPETERWMVSERIDDVAKGCCCIRVAGIELRKLAKIQPDIHPVLRRPVQRCLLVRNHLGTPIGCLDHSKQ